MRRIALAALGGLLLAAAYLTGQGPTVTRGPYLQMGTPTSVIVRWRTSTATDSRVLYGLTPGSTAFSAADSAVTTEHVVTLAGLAPNTQYYYSVGSTSTVLAGGDAAHFFVTSPSGAKNTRVWVLGDSGTGNATAAAVRDAYLNFNGSRYTDLWLMLGDNAYSSGLDSEYQTAVFNMYPTVLRQSVLWPTLGNHDGVSADSATQTGPYYDIFSLPTGGQAGGLASGTEAYYSFDYGNIHFICLESNETNRAANGPMATWAQADIASTNKDWVIAYWHHPPYSQGSHNSDTETQLIEMRQNFLPLLEGAGVDLVLAGHSHSYERSFLIDGHYGLSTTFTNSMKKDGGSGREDGSGAYKKQTLGKGSHEGTVYVVAGSSGQVSSVAQHPAMYIWTATAGSVVLDINNQRLDAKFLTSTGATGDYFSIVKGVPNAPSGLTAAAVSSSQINLAWTDNSSNEDGFRIERSTDGANFVEIAAVAAGAASYNNTGLNPSITYYYRVRGYNANGNGNYSNVASATTQSASPPADPSNLSASAVSSSQINLAWTDNSSDETGFQIERSTDGANFGQIATVGAGVTAYQNTGLAAGATYWYRVRATNGAGDSGYSNVASATTQNIAPPAAPSNLTATAVSSSQINLAWTDNSSDETGFQIERSTDGANFGQIAALGAGVTSYQNSGLAPGTTYWYRVRAVNSGGNSPYSNVATAATPSGSPPAAPSGLTAAAVSRTQINLAWTDNSSNETGFRIERSVNNTSNFTEIATVGSGVTAFSNTGLSGNTRYYYRVRAYNGAGNSAYSNTASARTPRK